MSVPVGQANDSPGGGSDFAGGVASAVISLPACMAYGIIAVAPLGTNFVSAGISAGFYCAIFGGLIAALLGGTPGMITGPKAPLALIFSSVVGFFVATNPLQIVGEAELPVSAMLCGFMVMFLGGLFQVAFGLLRLGSLIKFISYPVIAGFMNGTAVLIAQSQVWSFLGIPRGASVLELGDKFFDIQPLTALVGLITILVMWNSAKWTRKIHGSILGLLAGFAVYHALDQMGLGHRLGATIGKIPFEIPSPSNVIGFVALIPSVSVPDFLQYVVMAAFSIAVLGSIDSLLTSIYCQSQTNQRTNTGRELLAQGMGNMLAACFGGTAGAGSIGASAVSFQAGGRSRQAGAICGLTVLVVFFAFSGVVSMIPRAVLSGILLVISVKLFDSWSTKLFRMLLQRSNRQRAELWQNALVIMVVMLVTILKGLIIAVGIGVALSIVMFVFAMSKSVVRRVQDGTVARSHKQRDGKRMEWLRENGMRIAVIELEGAIFFGATDHISNTIESVADDGADYIVLDFKRVKELDISSARIIMQNVLRIRNLGKTIVVSYLLAQGPIRQAFEDGGLFDALEEGLCFDDTDAALEYVEEEMLAVHPELSWEQTELAIEDFEVMQGLAADDLVALRGVLERKTFGKGDFVFHQGDTDREMYFLVKGLADIRIGLENAGRTKRVQSFAVGTIFGEMALLDGAPRSANVVAAEMLTCYSLSLRDFERLQVKHPQSAIVFMRNLSRILAGRLRVANLMVRELEEQ